MKPRIKRAMLPRKGAYSVYVNEKCLPYESLHHFTVQEQFQCALWNPSQYVALLTLQQDQLGELARGMFILRAYLYLKSGSLVKRLRHRPFTAVTRVRFS